MISVFGGTCQSIRTETLKQNDMSNMITKVNVGKYGWPGPEKDVKYWVELDNGKVVGFRHGMSEGGQRRAKYAEFPVYNK